MPDPGLTLVVAAVIAALVALALWPERGAVARWRRARQASERAHTEDVLKYLVQAEVDDRPASLESVAGAVPLSPDEAARVLERLQARDLVRTEQAGIRLTPAGRQLGVHVLRAHRLLESYLADRTGFPEVEWHGRAHALEHGMSPADAEALSVRLQHPTHDPHGDPIPTAEGQFAGGRGVSLLDAPLDRPLRILHLEDEPEAVYAQLVALGLHPGLQVRLIEVSPRRVCLLAQGAEHVLAPLVAANVSVVPLAAPAGAEAPAGEPLNTLQPGEEARVLSISWRCRGPERRRLMDLGVLPGTRIRAEMRSPTGDPTAYRVRDALIALRAEQAELIRVERRPRQAAA
ncbi:MAG: FeoA domain-containing protein [Candidatus Methylomirabilales bacterium]